jgi:eukaryotic-like serine/threonine-protein kinase
VTASHPPERGPSEVGAELGSRAAARATTRFSGFGPSLGRSERAPGSAREQIEERALLAVRETELEIDLARARLMSRYGAPIWAGFAVYDVMQAMRPEVGHLPQLLFLRALATLLLAVLAVWGQRSEKSSRLRIEIGTTLSGMLLSFCLSLMSLYDGGFTSVYSPGIFLVMFTMASLPRPFRRGLRLNLLVILPYPIVMCLAALFSPQHAALLRERVVIAAAVQFHFALLASVLFVAFLSHMVWTLRRQLLAAQSLGRYQLTRPLGQGPLGEVWVAYHHGLRRDVAVKVLNRADVHDPSAAQRFEQVIYALGGLTHPNTVRLYDFGLSADGRPYYAMELLSGETLHSLIRREGRLSVSRATHLVLQVARSLSEAHARGIVHQNLKAENVFITPAGGERDFVKVVDYGLPPYAPGLLPVEATPAADVYALGALYFLLLTGEPVLKDELLGAEHERAPSPSARRGEALPDRIESVVVRCLESDPSERFSHARELVHALEGCLALLDSLPGAPQKALAGLVEARRFAREQNSEARALRAIPAPESDQTRIEDPADLEVLFGPANDDTETVVSR